MQYYLELQRKRSLRKVKRLKLKSLLHQEEKEPFPGVRREPFPGVRREPFPGVREELQDARELLPDARGELLPEKESIRLSEEKKKQQDLLRQEQEKVAARQRAEEKERELALQRQDEGESGSASAKQYENTQVTSKPVAIKPVEPVENQQTPPSGATAPWDGTPQKSSVDEISDVIREPNK
jgi:hypothetical protein